MIRVRKFDELSRKFEFLNLGQILPGSEKVFLTMNGLENGNTILRTFLVVRRTFALFLAQFETKTPIRIFIILRVVGSGINIQPNTSNHVTFPLRSF